ncbi:glycoside hydrolase [Collybia nuda]|uniref:Glycoside hydrolase n=1 Tax=Collybia nuda TaxID=64659 RepID=A0A9P5Y8B9_9AGAR|nr:glycoside hydrolase [Collybia nuda]
MISTAANRATFIDSAKQFIADYKIAGIDIDFEYPASIERNGPPTDTPNLTIFFKELRSGLGSSLISLATPAGYWFLKGFEMDKISTNLDFINMMSYDYRNWDSTVEGANSTAQPQSSLLDMVDSTLLYVKAGVDLKKVNLGLAWYGRTFKLEDKTCAGYNCDMSGGGTKGVCTGESGVLANFEIDDIIMEADARPVYHEDSETRWFIDYKGDLITFDDEGTWKAKTDYAKKRCFGGTMIWAIDQEIPKCWQLS